MNNQQMTCRAGAVVLALGVLAGCGGGEDDATSEPAVAAEVATDDDAANDVAAIGVDDAAAAAPVTTERATDTLPPVGATVGLEEWGDDVAAAWSTLLDDRTAAAIRFIEAVTTGGARFDATQLVYADLVAATDRFEQSLPGGSGDARLDAALETLLDGLAQERDLAAGGLALGESEPDRIRDELERAGDAGFPGTDYGAIYVQFDELEPVFTSACFELQDLMTSSGLPVLDCTGSGSGDAADDAAAEVATDSPTSEETGAVFADLPPGVHEFTVFGPGLTIETTEPLVVRTGVDFIVFRPGRDEGPDVTLVAPTAIDPTTIDQDPGRASWGPVPDDFGAWLDALPVEIESTSTIDLAGTAAAVFVVRADPDALDAAVGNPDFLPVLAWSGDPATDAQFELAPVTSFATTYFIEWPRPGGRLFLTVEVDDPSADPTGWIVDLLAGVVAP